MTSGANDRPRAPLPIDAHLEAVCEAFRSGRNVVVVAPPGAGKTTRVPVALLEAGAFPAGQLVVLEPRRIAARMSAERAAFELGEAVGERIGYATRFERRIGERTTVRFVTEGLLTRQLLTHPRLDGVSAVLLDEFHERHLTSDLALALLRRLQKTVRPDLRLGVMSATLAHEPVARYLDADVIRTEGRSHPVAIEHLPRPDDRPLELLVQSAVLRLRDEGLEGDVLTFLPGARAIRRAEAACENLAKRHGLALRSLFGSQTAADQDRAIARADRPKIILATNVAETSITIDGVVAVIDSGLCQVAHQPPWSTLPVLREGPVSQASAAQRAGRAGRTRPGRCLRLYTELDFARRDPFERPEIERVDLTEAVLELGGAGIHDPGRLEWFDPPPAASLASAHELLVRLGAVERAPERGLTEIGRRMLRFPLHPRLARLMVESERRGYPRLGAAAAALLSERGLYAGATAPSRFAGESDVLSMLEDYEAATGPGGGREIAARGIDRGRLAAARRVADRLLDVSRSGSDAVDPEDDPDRALSIAVLTGFVDRLGRLRRPERSTGRAAREIAFAAGSTAALADHSVVTNADLVVAVDAEERSAGRDRRPVVRVASAVDVDWILELFTDEVVETRTYAVKPGSGKVERTDRLTIGSLVLEERSSIPAPGPETRAALLEAARARGLDAFFDRERLARLRRRVELSGDGGSAELVATVDEDRLWSFVDEACGEIASLDELTKIDFDERIASTFSPRLSGLLRDAAPDHVTLPGGRRVRVHYPSDAPPFIESRLQDFFGMVDGPRVGSNAPLVLHLLAPNGRAVQVTTDLRGFWEKHYPGIAKELRRRYPRHAWPDDPKTARPPPPPTGRRPRK